MEGTVELYINNEFHSSICIKLDGISPDELADELWKYCESRHILNEELYDGSY